MQYLFSIPIVIGLVIGVFLYAVESDSVDSVKLTVQQLGQNGSPILGDKNAPITILEWGDYQCTFCHKFHESTLKTIKSKYVDSGDVKIIFKDFPLNGRDSLYAAVATHCAKEQKMYWEYHDKMYENWGGERTGWITSEKLQQIASKLELDTIQFKKCLDENRYEKYVLDMQEFATKIGIDATPTFLIYSDKQLINIRGNQPLEVFDKVISQLK